MSFENTDHDTRSADERRSMDEEFELAFMLQSQKPIWDEFTLSFSEV